MNKFAKEIIDIDGRCMSIKDLSCDNCPLDKQCATIGGEYYSVRVELAKLYIADEIKKSMDE
jgi:hypothetical protein